MPDTKVAFDASTIIAMDNPHVKMVDFVLQYFLKTGHVLVMCTENLVECFTQKKGLRSSGALKEVNPVDERIFLDVKDFCKQKGYRLNNDNDYKGIATAFQEKCKFFVSYDYKQKLGAEEYTKSKSMDLTSVTPPLFMMYMHLAERVLYPWNKNIEFTVNMYQYEELPNIFEGIHDRGWNQHDALDRFMSYGKNINTTVSAQLAAEETKSGNPN